MSETERGQVSASAAQLYERFFVPALFAEPAAKIVNAVGIGSGQKVLDVACGTGVLARATANAVGDEGRVVGLDVKPTCCQSRVNGHLASIGAKAARSSCPLMTTNSTPLLANSA